MNGRAGPTAARYDPGVRRLGRILWTTFAAASLLCCAAAAGVWVRSYFVADRAEFPAADSDWTLIPLRGKLTIVRRDAGYGRSISPDRPRWRYERRDLEDVPPRFEDVVELPWDWEFPGVKHFGLSNRVGGHGGTFRLDLVEVRLAYLLAGLGIAPVGWLVAMSGRRRRRTRRELAGLCANCGYDLRASPTRCPECGTVPAR